MCSRTRIQTDTAKNEILLTSQFRTVSIGEDGNKTPRLSLWFTMKLYIRNELFSA